MRTRTQAMVILFILVPVFLVIIQSCGKSEVKLMEDELKSFIQLHEEKVVPLSRNLNLAYFEASITGSDSLYKEWERLEVELSKIYANKTDFEQLKRIKDSGKISDPILQRQLTVLYNGYLSKQIGEDELEAMIRKQAEIEKKYSTFRAEVAGKKLTDNQIEDILKTETDSKELKTAWLASKQVGAAVEKDVLEMVRMRNQAAVELGFPNFHTMKLQLSEQDPAQIEALFDELDELTRNAFAGLKKEIDDALSKRYGVPAKELMPWHYQNRFFQEAPRIYNVDLDKYYKDKDLVALTRDYYAGIGLPIADLVEKSDLFEREGKYQHAYCTDIDREGDVRVVCNIQPNYNWMNTMLHEYGHAVYDKYADRSLPWLIREPAHTFTTEAIAMLFGRFAANPEWMQAMLKLPEAEVKTIAGECTRSKRLEQLVFSRWAQVMYRFEKAMYENPEQDLNALWWQLVHRYQMLRKPGGRNQPDWASKIHVALYPAYYHNYLMGELLASQLYYYITDHVADSAQPFAGAFVNQKEVGQFLIEKVFRPGKRFYWNEMIEKATGEKLTARYYARQFVQ